MRQENIEIIPSQAAGNITGSPIMAVNLLYVSAQVVTVGAGAAGTLKLQASNDDPMNATTPVNWNDVTGASVATSGAGAFLIPKTDLCYQYIRFVYTNTGTGTLSARCKALGA